MFLNFRHVKSKNKTGCAMKASVMRGLKSMKIKTLISMYIVAISFFSLTSVSAKTITLEIGGAQILKFEGGVSEVFIANPDVADVQVSNPKAAYIFAKTAGTTKLFAMNAKGEEILNAEIVVIHNLSYLKEMIAPYDPHELVEVKSVPGGILLEGMVDSPKTAEDIRSLADKFLDKGASQSGSSGQTASSGQSATSGQTVINRMTIKPPVQVQLRVKVAEVDRTVLNQLAFDWQAVFANIGNFNFAALTGRTPFTGAPTPTTVNTLTQDVTSLIQSPISSTSPGLIANTLGAGFTNLPHTNFGCADAANFGMMIANPRDLVKGRTLGASEVPLLPMRIYSFHLFGSHILEESVNR